MEREITWKRTLRVWWLIAWRGGVGATAISFVVGMLIGLAGFAFSWEMESITLVSSLVGMLLGVACSAVAVRMAMRKHYRGFRLVIMPVGQDAATPVAVAA